MSDSAAVPSPSSARPAPAVGDGLLAQIDALLRHGIRRLIFPADLEQRFTESILRRRQRHHALMAVIGCLLYDAFMLADALMIPDVMTLSAVIRLGVITPIVLGIAWLAWRGWFTPIGMERVAALMMTVATGTLVFLMLSSNHPNVSHYYVGVPLIIVFANTLQRLRFRYALLGSLGCLAVTSWGLGHLQGITPEVHQTLFMVMLSTCGLTLAALYRLEYDERYTWLLRLREAHLGRHDTLTQLPNRRALEEHMSALLRPGTPPEALPVYLLLLDLDHFKLVNDSCGHAEGDRLLSEVVRVWREQLRPEDYLARVGGDEFAVVMQGLTEDAARAAGERLVASTDSFRFVNHETQATFSIGLSVGLAKHDGTQAAGEATFADLFIKADMACYAAKQLGRGRVSQYRSADGEIVFVKDTVDWGPRIRRAIDENRLRLYLQKIVGATGETEGYETLIRMVDERGRTVSPGEFLPAAKRLGLTTAIDRWVCSAVIERLKAGTVPKGYVSVNLVPGSISDGQFAEWLIEELRQLPEAVGRLRFEIIETDQLRIGPSELSLFQFLHSFGFSIYLDDFGSGYNSFDLVKRLPLDGIKLDGNVVRDYLTDPVDQALVQAATSIARRMGLKLIAEGVENTVILHALQALDITNFQGYLFHVPEPIDSVWAREQAASGDDRTPSQWGELRPVAPA